MVRSWYESRTYAMTAAPPTLRTRTSRTAPREEGSPLYRISMEVSRHCNLHCAYCYSGAGATVQPVMDAEDVRTVLSQAFSLGARLVSFVWGGEPFTWPGLLADDGPLAFTNGLGAYAHLYTNGSLVRGPEASRLAALDVSVIAKCNSLRAEVQDRLVGVPGASAAIRRGLDALLEAGLAAPGVLRLGVETVISPLNYEEMPDLWRYFRRHGMIPEVEIPTQHGRATQHTDLLYFPFPEAREKYRALFEELARIDAQEFGYHWDPRPPFPAGTCRLIDKDRNCYVTHDGTVQPCAGVEQSFGRLAVGPNRSTGAPLHAIVTAPAFQRLRRIRELLSEPCRSCKCLSDCYGCRGAAFHHSGDMFGPDPFCWRHRT